MSSVIRTEVQDIIIHHCVAQRTLFAGTRGPSNTLAPDISAVGTADPNPLPISLSQDVLVQNLPKSLSELPNAVGVDEGIHYRVGMGEDDSNVDHPDVWALTVVAQVVETIDDVQGKPTEGKQTHNDSQ